jgi:hypothetical protein
MRDRSESKSRGYGSFTGSNLPEATGKLRERVDQRRGNKSGGAILFWGAGEVKNRQGVRVTKEGDINFHHAEYY